MTTPLFTIVCYNPDKPGTQVVAQVYGRKEANALRDSYSAKHPENVYKVLRGSA